MPTQHSFHSHPRRPRHIQTTLCLRWIVLIECCTTGRLVDAVAWISPRHHRRQTSTLASSRAFAPRGVAVWSSTTSDSSSSSVNAVSPPSSDTEWYDLYKTVALQDPEWFEQHVMGLMSSTDDGGDAIVNDELLLLVQQAKEQRSLRPPEPPSSDFLETTDTVDVDLIPRSNGEVDVLDTPVPATVVSLETYSNETVTTPNTVVEDTDKQTANSSLVESTAVAAPVVAPTLDVQVDERPPLVRTESSPNEVQVSQEAVVRSDTLLDDRVVVYLDEGAVWKRVDLVTFLRLGYSEAEIVSLQPTVLRLIATDVIFRPRTGVPVRWLVSDSDDTALIPTVQIVPAVAAAVVMNELQLNEDTGNSTVSVDAPNEQRSESENKSEPMERMQSPGTTVESSRLSSEAETLPSDSLEVSVAQNSTISRNMSGTRGTNPVSSASDWNPRRERDTSNASQRRRNDDTLTAPKESQPRPSSSSVEQPASRQTQDRQRRETRDPVRPNDEPPPSQRSRRVYNGRSAPAPSDRQQRLDDPPPPKGVWPDLDTFRNLLREEAGMRLRILGSDWSDAVKDEADWRLDLYQNWLWTLHRGWGEPLVESRSDRARRNQPPPSSSSPSSTTDPRSSTRKPRNRE